MIIDDLVTIIAAASITGIVSVALNLMISVARFINLGAGAIMALGAYTAYIITSSSQLGALVTGVLVFLISSIVGFMLYLMFNNIGLFDSTEHIIEDISVLTSYGFHLFIVGSLSLLFGARYTSVKMNLEIPLDLSFIREPEFIIILSALVTVSILHLVFTQTNFGLKARAIIQNMQTSIAIGINTKRVIAIVFILSFGVFGLAGSLYVLLYPLSPYFGLYYVVLGFVAAGVAGIGNLLHAFLISVIITMLYSILGLFIPIGVAIAISYVLMLTLLVAKPEGLKRGLR